MSLGAWRFPDASEPGTLEGGGNQKTAGDENRLTGFTVSYRFVASVPAIIEFVFGDLAAAPNRVGKALYLPGSA